MSLPVVFGAARKVYARAVRLALEEKATSMTYSDDVFGPPLRPDDPCRRARMNQACSTATHTARWSWGVFVERVRPPAIGRAQARPSFAATAPGR